MCRFKRFGIKDGLCREPSDIRPLVAVAVNDRLIAGPHSGAILHLLKVLFMRLLLTFFLMIFAGLAQAQTSGDPFAQPDFLPATKAFVFTSEPLPSGEISLKWKIADEYYLYQKRF